MHHVAQHTQCPQRDRYRQGPARKAAANAHEHVVHAQALATADRQHIARGFAMIKRCDDRLRNVFGVYRLTQPLARQQGKNPRTHRAPCDRRETLVHADAVDHGRPQYRPGATVALADARQPRFAVAQALRQLTLATQLRIELGLRAHRAGGDHARARPQIDSAQPLVEADQGAHADDRTDRPIRQRRIGDVTAKPAYALGRRLIVTAECDDLFAPRQQARQQKAANLAAAPKHHYRHADLTAPPTDVPATAAALRYPSPACRRG